MTGSVRLTWANGNSPVETGMLEETLPDWCAGPSLGHCLHRPLRDRQSRQHTTRVQNKNESWKKLFQLHNMGKVRRKESYKKKKEILDEVRGEVSIL